MELTRMQRAINHALSGDKKAKDLLDIGDQDLVPATRAVTAQTLKADFKYAATPYFAATNLNLRAQLRLAKKYIIHLFWIDRHFVKSSVLTDEATFVNENDILEEMSLLCTDLPLTRPPKDLSDSEQEEDGQLQSGVEEIEEDDLKSKEKRPRSVSNTKKKCQTPDTEDKSSKVAKWSHHRKLSCQVPGCKFEGFDLKRHMQVHVRKGEIAEQNVKKMNSIVSRGQKQRGKSLQRNKDGKRKKGRLRKWCPVPGCDSIIVNVGRHLSSSKSHNIQKNSSHYIRLSKIAKCYTGSAELQVCLETPYESDEEEEHEEEEQQEEEEPHKDEQDYEDDEELQMEQGSQSGDVKDRKQEAEDGEDSEEHDKETREERDSKESDEESSQEHYSEESESEDSDSGDEKQTAEKFFTATKYNNNRHRWLVGFYDYLSRPSAGHKKKYIKLQHAGQMRNILEFIDKNGDDIKFLTWDEGDAVWKRFVVPSLECQTKKSGTIISYLTSYEKFLNYVTNPRYNRSGPPLYQSYIDILVAILPEIKGWRSTVDSETQAEQKDRWLDESAGLLTPEEITALKQSKPYIEGLKAIHPAGKRKGLSQNEFTAARDLLLVQFATDNGTRPGPLNNAKLSDYEKAESSQGNRVMLISKHKRAKDGPAILGMKPDLQNLMEIYVNKIRPQWAARDENHLFVTVEGKAFPEGTIGRRFQAFMEKAKLRDGKKMAHVSVRKFVTTKTKEEGSQEEAAIVQRVMAHSAKTAERAYVRSNLTELGSKALHIIERVTAESGKKKQHESEETVTASTQKRSASVETVAASKRVHGSEDSEGPKAAATSTLGRRGSVETTAAPKPTISAEQEQGPDCEEAVQPSNAADTVSTSTYSVSLLSTAVVPPTPDRGLTVKQEEAILKVFNKEITAGTKVTTATAQTRCCATSILAVLASSINRVKQVVNHVNYIIESNPRSAPTKDPEPSTSKVHGWLEDYDEPSTRSSGKRQEKDEAETAALEKAFRKYRLLSSTAEIREILQKDSKLYEIMKRECWGRLYTKIKNIFKKKGKK